MFAIIVLSEFIGSLSDYGVFYIYSLSATLVAFRVFIHISKYYEISNIDKI